MPNHQSTPDGSFRPKQLENEAHITHPVAMNRSKKLVTMMRVPYSDQDGTKFMGLCWTIQLFLSKLFAASIPACKDRIVWILGN